MSMTKYQRIVLGVGLLLVILNGLFPPFEGEIKGLKHTPMVTEDLGYHFILRPPVRSDVLKAMLYEVLLSMDSDQFDSFRRMSEIYQKEVKLTKIEADESAADGALSPVSLSIRSHIEMSRFLVQLITIVGAT
ncbi:MAG: hypothetical protein ABSE90_05890, partial [Verrucomicrobiota bacterium]